MWDMKPSEVSSALRHIATKIDASKNPSIAKVRAALRGLMAQVTAEEQQAQQQGYGQQQQQQGQQQQQALPKSDAGKKMVLDMLSQAEKALQSGDDDKFRSIVDKLSRQP